MRTTRIWTAFVLGWLLVLVVMVVVIFSQPLTLLRQVAAQLAMLALASLYFWCAMRDAIEPADLAPSGPSVVAIRRRLAFIAGMLLTLIWLGIALPRGGEAWWLSMFPIVAAGLVLPPRLAAVVIALLIFGSLMIAWIVGPFDPMLLILIPFGACATAMRQLTVSVAQLRAARQELARAAVDQERLRFARDLHDVLGHALSVIILKSELAGRLLPSSPARAAVEVKDVERAAREAQQEVRAAVMGYRQPELTRELAGARELLAAAGVDANVSDAISGLPVALDGLLAWAVREGVTNVIRHSRAQRCAIDVTRNGESIRLVVTDNGRGVNGVPNGGGGNGLAGLAERAAAHGAVLEAGPRAEGGFQLVLTAPLAANS